MRQKVTQYELYCQVKIWYGGKFWYNNSGTCQYAGLFEVYVVNCLTCRILLPVFSVTCPQCD